MNVARASHEYAVQLIREARNELVLRVLTVSSTSAERQQSFNASHYTDGKAA